MAGCLWPSSTPLFLICLIFPKSGWEEELRRLGEVVKKINAMQPKPKFFLIGGDLVNSFPQTAPYPSGPGVGKGFISLATRMGS
jgi:hypothetical protein